MYRAALIAIVFCMTFCNSRNDFDIIIRNGMVYDGSGRAPTRSDIGINQDTIAFIGDLTGMSAGQEIDAAGMAVAPGFINMLSWANESLIEDGRSQSDIRQGVTLEVLGEGWSMGPLNERLKSELENDQSVIRYKVDWTTLGEYMSRLEQRGVSCNIASFVGATTVRQYVVGEDDRAPTSLELDSMRMLVRQAMQEGAMGVSSSLVYPPAFFATTSELTALASEAGKSGGRYISHIRNEGNQLEKAVDEILTIAREANVGAEIYHLKASGRNNWGKMDAVINKIEEARAAGLDITANMYLYTAAATGLSASFPPRVQDGGFGVFWKQLQNPVMRNRLTTEISTDAKDWDNFYYASGSPAGIMLLGFRRDSLRKYIGKTLEEVASARGVRPEIAAMDLIIQDSSRIDVAYSVMSAENIEKQVALPWMSYGSDAGSYATEGNFLKFNTHPRAYGNFARLLGLYVREKQLIPLEEAIRKLTSLPAANLKLKSRGQIAAGYFADIVIFRPESITDHATFAEPHQYATGMEHVFVNGVQVLKNGEHTNAKPGRFIKGPGAR